MLLRVLFLDILGVIDLRAGLKGVYVKQPIERARQTDVLFALRETAKDLLEVRLWAVIGTILLLVALAGPFYTMETLGLGGRLLYWAVVGTTSALLMWALNRVSGVLLPAHWPRMAVGAFAGCVGVLPMMGLVALANAAAGLGLPQAGFWGLFPYVAPTVIGVSALVHLLVTPADTGPAAPSSVLQSGLFSRLPAALGKDIIALQAQDHYINVITPHGHGLILMRMSDAVQDLAGLPGMQVHRSWWINLDHVNGLEKTETGGAQLVLTNDLYIPVPKSRRTELRQAIAARNSHEA